MAPVNVALAGQAALLVNVHSAAVPVVADLALVAQVAVAQGAVELHVDLGEADLVLGDPEVGGPLDELPTRLKLFKSIAHLQPKPGVATSQSLAVK